MQYDINEGNFLTFKDDEEYQDNTPIDPDADIPDNTEDIGFRYNNYGSTMYATSENEPECCPDEPECDCEDDGDEEYSEDDSEDCSDEEEYDDSEEYNDAFIDL